MKLQDKVAIITGAGTGMGRECARLFVHEGAKVALAARHEARLNSVARDLASDKAIAITADIAAQADIDRVVGTAITRFGRIDVLVNSAAVLIAGTAESQTEGSWDETFNTNVRGLWLLSRAAIPHMRAAGGGSIINIASVVGLIGASNRAAYGASKGAVLTLTKCMALDLAPDRIRVNAICPGIVETDLVADFINKAPDPEAARKQRLALHPVGRFGSVTDIANAAVFLASDDSTWITGAAIPIDGGYTAGKA